MIKKLLLLSVAISTGTVVCAAPERDLDRNRRPDDRRPIVQNGQQAPAKPQAHKPAHKPAPVKPQAHKPAHKPAPVKPQAHKPAHKPAPANVVVKPLLPAPAPVVTTSPYRIVRNTYTIQLNPDKTIIFEQRYVGVQELRDKIRMVKYDHPRPHIRIKVVEGVDAARLNFALDELKKAGFHNVEIIRIKRRVKFVPQQHIPGKRIKR